MLLFSLSLKRDRNTVLYNTNTKYNSEIPQDIITNTRVFKTIIQFIFERKNIMKREKHWATHNYFCENPKGNMGVFGVSKSNQKMNEPLLSDSQRVRN